MKLRSKALLLPFAMCAFFLTGCSSESAPTENPNSASSDTSAVISQSSSAETNQPGSGTASDSSSGSDSSSQEESPLSENWEDLDIMIDGVVFKYPYVYHELEDAGWVLTDKEARGLPAGAKVMSSFLLENEKYTTPEYDSSHIICGFINNGTEFAELVDCDIWAFHFSANMNPNSELKPADLELAKNIHLGSSEEEIVAAYGPYDFKREGYGFKNSVVYDIILYNKEVDGRNISMELSLNEFGLFNVSLAG